MYCGTTIKEDGSGAGFAVPASAVLREAVLPHNCEDCCLHTRYNYTTMLCGEFLIAPTSCTARLCPICLIHPIEQKFLKFEKQIRLASNDCLSQWARVPLVMTFLVAAVKIFHAKNDYFLLIGKNS